MALAVGARLGDYTVTAKIGEGGMGVYRARDTKLDRDVAFNGLIFVERWFEELTARVPAP